ncbi:MAG: hypothetical protein LUC83_03930, partial [Clostridiales bacterium]|nr:hypothetical protein [Clostridiales bacterium]
YDEDLKEWYGLVASCQNISDFYSVTASYFDGMMSAAGIDGTASELFTSYLSSLETGSNFADFLQVEITGTTTVTAVDNSSLENAALLEDEIVEFMKYRGPVEIFDNLIDRLSSMSLTDDLNDSAENEPIVEAKQEYAEAEGDFLEAVLYTYIATLSYQNYYVANGVPSASTYSTCETELKNIYSDLGSVTELITKYYAFTSDLKNLKSSFTVVSTLPTVSGSGTGIKTSYNGTNYTPTTIGAELNEEGDAYTLDAEAASALVEDYKTWISNVKNNASSIVTACNGITSPSSSSDINPAVYL